MFLNIQITGIKVLFRSARLLQRRWQSPMSNNLFGQLIFPWVTWLQPSMYNCISYKVTNLMRKLTWDLWSIQCANTTKQYHSLIIKLLIHFSYWMLQSCTGGSGGKGTWGSLFEREDNCQFNPNDPNYDSSQVSSR